MTSSACIIPPPNKAMFTRLVLPLFYIFPNSNLAVTAIEQLDARATNSQLTSLLNLSLEDDLVAVAPHLRDEGLAGVNSTSKADLDVLKGAKGLVDGLAGDAEEAETVKNGALETAHLGKGGINVKGAVTTH